MVEKHPGNVGLRWEMTDEGGEPAWFFKTLAQFRRTVDRWERDVMRRYRGA